MNRDVAMTITLGLFFVLVIVVTTGCPSNPEPGADLLLVNGRVYTFAWGEPSLDGRILATIAAGTVVFESPE